MARLADDAPLSGITIPGTHDSGARFGGVAPVVDFVTALWVQCQNWTVTQQLNAGVRFLDVRCHAEPDGTLRIHHLFVDEELSLDRCAARVRRVPRREPDRGVADARAARGLHDARAAVRGGIRSACA